MSFSFESKDEVSTLHPNIISFVPRYIKNRRDDYEKLKVAVEKTDFYIIRDYCHKVLGTARSYHFFQLEEITRRLQELARSSDIKGIRRLMSDYDEYIQSVFELYLSDSDSQKP